MNRTRLPRRALPVLVLGSLLAFSRVSAGEGVSFGPDDTQSVLFIAKSQNKNQVHYGVHLDSHCNPVGSAPVFGYWRMLEQRGQVEPILEMEEPAYGVADGQTVLKNPGGTTIRVRLRAFAERPLAIVIKSSGGRCEAIAKSTISGIDAQLAWIYVKLRWPFGVEYMLVRGLDGDGRLIDERIRN